MEVRLDIDGKKVKVHAQWLQQQLWVHVSGKTFVVDPMAGKKISGRKNNGGNSDTVKAPMPGKITKIFVNAGDLAYKGQALIVMEAMKMEYTIKAEIDGKVQQIEVQVGDQVSLGKKLIKIEPGK